ncbi:MAG: threonine synthase [candidate division WOR-3 bacterium]|nr:threonine synthase [candidate division WOR-3 bacterium]
MPSLLYSTNLQSPDVDLKGALLQGQAPDKGLYMPREIPRILLDEIIGFRDKSYPEIAFAVLRRYTQGLIPDEELMRLCTECYNYIVPIERVYGRSFLMRLDQGPTASFKDFAARMMARMMRYFLAQEGGELVILTATSGDTGSAVAHAFHNVDRISMVVLFPIKEVSDRQRKQMTTLGGNVTVIGVDGQFDDCQALVKRAFTDPELGRIRFSSANSINIGRLLPQAVYYLYAWAKLQENDEAAVISVPSGNFGDICGGLIARRMGLPVDRFVIATNANDEFPKFVATGKYEKVVPSRVCISNAMNVGHPSNLPRFVALYGGVMDEQGKVSKQPDFAAMRRDIYAVSIDDAGTRQAIKEAWQKYKTMLEPHGAVGWAGLVRYLESLNTRPLDPSPLAISIETAHPAKFPEEIQRLLGVDPPLPPSLAGLDAKPEHYEKGPNDYGWFSDFLKRKFPRG